MITRAQLLAAGVGAGATSSRLRRGRLQHLHRGVYLVGLPPPSFRARAMAAVLACGAHSLVSHRSGVVLWGLIEGADPAVVDITVVGRSPRTRRGIRMHRTPEMDRGDRRILDRIPVTAPARTLLDAATQVTGQELEQALASALARRLIRSDELPALLARNRARPGVAPLRKLLEAGDPAFTRSRAESRLLSLIDRAKLPRPEVNAPLAGYEVDFVWRSDGLVVEADGFEFHSTRSAFERDRARDAELQARGFRVIRVTWRQIVDEPDSTIARLKRALGAARPASPTSPEPGGAAAP